MRIVIGVGVLHTGDQPRKRPVLNREAAVSGHDRLQPPASPPGESNKTIAQSAWMCGQTTHVCLTEMMVMPMTRPRTNESPSAAFIAKKAEIDSILELLAALSAEHFNVEPDRVTWSDVGSLERYATGLREIADAAFREGEYAG